jgi:hypothetical protein
MVTVEVIEVGGGEEEEEFGKRVVAGGDGVSKWYDERHLASLAGLR